MEASVNEDCIFCDDMCPQIFSLGDEFAEVIVKEIYSEHQECCREAADSCPTEAIEISD